MKNESAVAIDEDVVSSPHYLPAEMRWEFAAERHGRHSWIWTLIASTMLTTMGLAVWLANKL